MASRPTIGGSRLRQLGWAVSLALCCAIFAALTFKVNSVRSQVRLAERQMPGALSSVLLLDDAGQHVRVGAAPSLPSEYNAAIHGLAIGPRAGSCGTAAYRGERVVVSDIDNDPLWTDYLPLVQPHGLKACWSTPIKANDGRVLGTFAFYYREPRGPSSFHQRLIEVIVHLCSLALQREESRSQIRQRCTAFRPGCCDTAARPSGPAAAVDGL